MGRPKKDTSKITLNMPNKLLELLRDEAARHTLKTKEEIRYTDVIRLAVLERYSSEPSDKELAEFEAAYKEHIHDGNEW